MKRAKKILSVMLAMCLTTIMICGNTADRLQKQSQLKRVISITLR